MLSRAPALVNLCYRRAPRYAFTPGSVVQASMSACTQGIAVSEEPHCWARAPRWKEYFVDEDSTVSSIPVSIVQSAEEEILSAYGPLAVALATLGKPGFQAKAGETLLVPNSEGRLERVLVGPGSSNGAPEPWPWAALPTKLPAGFFHLQLPEDSPVGLAEQACLGWALGCYVFDRYKKAETQNEDGKPTTPRVAAKLVWPVDVDRSSVGALADAFFWSRDLINSPAEDLGPGHMCAEAKAMAAMHQATVNIIQGDELLEAGYPAVHTVGRACSRPPALIDIRWTPQGAGDVASLPRLSLVGKGVCFDSGGLDIKTAAGMKTMKKDMGGAALVLALAHVIMNGGLPVQLRVLVPTVENSIAGNAYRPADVLRTRAGITVENGNTDAEGRLILCDALYEASTEIPDLIVDAATLTGAARVALGPELLAVFTNCDDTWKQIDNAAKAQSEGVWRLPLYPQYRKLMDSKVADISSTGGEGAQGGAILAALYLLEFVKKAPRWVHIDTNAWVAPSMTGPGRPEGGEPMGLRALWQWMQTRYPKTA